MAKGNCAREMRACRWRLRSSSKRARRCASRAKVVALEEADAVEIGMAVEVEFVDHDDELTLPAFRPVGG